MPLLRGPLCRGCPFSPWTSLLLKAKIAGFLGPTHLDFFGSTKVVAMREGVDRANALFLGVFAATLT